MKSQAVTVDSADYIKASEDGADAAAGNAAAGNGTVNHDDIAAGHAGAHHSHGRMAYGSFRKSGILYIIVTAILFCVLMGIGSQKEGFHKDELFAFRQSNHQYSLNNSVDPDIEYGVSYSGEAVWREFFTLDDGGRFDYANVIRMLKNNVHPPLFHLLLHTVCSLFPTLPLKWQGLLVTVPLACVVYWQMVWLAGRFGWGKRAALLLSACYVLSLGFLNFAVVYIRMYTLMSVWVNFLIMIFIRYRAGEKGAWSYYLSLGAVLLGGMLTQYYFAVYAALLCLCYAVLAALARNVRKICGSIASAAVAGAAWFILYPQGFRQIFSSYRSTQSVENLLAEPLFARLVYFLQKVSKYIFGRHLSELLVILAALAAAGYLKILWGKGKRFFVGQESNGWQETRGQLVTRGQTGTRDHETEKCVTQDSAAYCFRGNRVLADYFLLLLPACLHIVLVAKMAPYTSPRYVIAVCGLLFLGIFSILRDCAQRLVGGARLPALLALLVCAAITLLGHHGSKIDYLYAGYEDYAQILQTYTDTPCLILFDQYYRFFPDFYDIRYLNDVTFMNEEYWEECGGFALTSDTLVLYVTRTFYMDTDTVLEQLMAWNDYSSYEIIYESATTREETGSGAISSVMKVYRFE